MKITTKKITAVLICLTMLLSVFSLLPAYASEKTASGVSYEVNWSLYSDGVFYVSGEGWMAEYSSEEELPWKDYRDQITSVVFGEGVVNVSYYGFYGCENLTSITFENDRLYRIGEYAFYNCESLKTVSIPEGVREVGHNAFGCDEEGKGLEKVYIYARNAELSFYYDEDDTFPAHTLVYGYECSSTEADSWCAKYGRTFVPFEDGCVVDINKGDDCLYDFDNDADVADLWKASKAENGTQDSIVLDYNFVLDAEKILEPHNYMVDSESEMLKKDGGNDGRIEVEFALDVGERTVYKTYTYSYCPEDLDRVENEDYLTWSTYAAEHPFFSMVSDGVVANISFNGTLKDICDEYDVENPEYASLHIRITGITTYKKYQYGKYYNTDKETQMEFHYMSLYDAHTRDVWVEDVGSRPLDRAIFVTDEAGYPGDGIPGHYQPVKREYVWDYEFSRICSDYDWENMEQAPGDGGWDEDIFTEEYKGVLYGHARGTYNAGSDNSMRFSDFITSENREFILSLVGVKSWDVQIMAYCTVTFTYEDGSTLTVQARGGSEGTYIIAPCMHACAICGLCTETEKMLPCNFNSNEWRSIYCECEAPVVATVETELIEDVSIDMDNSMIYCEPTVVVEKIDLEQAADTGYVKHITKGLASDKAVMVFNIDVFDGEMPYIMNQWGGDEFLTVTIPVGSETAQRIKDGEIMVYHIGQNGSPEPVEIDIENGVDVENGTITFSSSSFSPFVLVEASEETNAGIEYNEDDGTCTAQITLTKDDLDKSPLIYVAFYNSKGSLIAVKQKNATTLADKFTVGVPDNSVSFRIMVWDTAMKPLCEYDFGEISIPFTDV